MSTAAVQKLIALADEIVGGAGGARSSAREQQASYDALVTLLSGARARVRGIRSERVQWLSAALCIYSQPK